MTKLPMEAPKPISTHASRQAAYKPKNIGFPVEHPEMTWQDLTMEQRKQWFRSLQNRWRDRFAQRGDGSQLTITTDVVGY